MPTAYGSRFLAHRSELLDKVADTGIFKLLTADERREMLAHSEMHTFKNDEYLFRQGDDGRRTLFFVVAGEVDIFLEGGKEPRRIATMHVGEFFGEMSMLEGLPRSASTRAKGTATVLEFDLANKETSPEVTLKVLTHIAQGLSQKLRKINSVILEQTA